MTMLRARLQVGTIIIAFMCLAFAADYVWQQPLIVAGISGLVGALGAYELCAMARRAGREPFRGLAVGGTVACIAAACIPEDGSFGWRCGDVLAVLLVVLVAAALLRQRLRGTLRGALVNAGITVFVVLYVGLLLSFVMRIRLLSNGGLAGVALVVFAPKLGDVGAYAFGNLVGGWKLAPMISPNKTVSGSMGGLIVSVVVGVAVCLISGLFAFWPALGVSAMIGILGQLGDLSESVIKRDLEAKDSSSSLPGFGGVLDILDSLLFVAPALYVVLRLSGA
ncbi:MAG: phosphatidate cytidylyltransferase [Planctomycetes bacterium]|nr:phosphatidate cytidylyltransferase [Planctomycetota bacterium]